MYYRQLFYPHTWMTNYCKILCLLQFSLRLHRIPWEFPQFSTFREIPEYSRVSRFVATLLQRLVSGRWQLDTDNYMNHPQYVKWIRPHSFPWNTLVKYYPTLLQVLITRGRTRHVYVIPIMLLIYECNLIPTVKCQNYDVNSHSDINYFALSLFDNFLSPCFLKNTFGLSYTLVYTEQAWSKIVIGVAVCENASHACFAHHGYCRGRPPAIFPSQALGPEPTPVSRQQPKKVT